MTKAGLDIDAEAIERSAHRLTMTVLMTPDTANFAGNVHGGTILKLLDRSELSKLQYFDRETDPKNPSMRSLNEAEKQRILINTILACQNYTQPDVQAAIKRLSEFDPSERVKQAAMEVTGKKKT